jgi:hypothetical protein
MMMELLILSLHSAALGVFDVVGVLLIEIGGIVYCVRIARQFNPAA